VTWVFRHTEFRPFLSSVLDPGGSEVLVWQGEVMLTKLESLYLGLLRGFILVAATLALVASALLVITTVPDLLTRAGLTKAEAPRSSLAEFISEQKPQEQAAQTDPGTPKLAVDPDISKAAQNIRRYLADRATIPVTTWEQALQGAKNGQPAALQSRYAASVVTLTDELLASKGRPLSERRVTELLDWHDHRFAASVQDEEAAKAAADAAFKFKMGAAFGALLLFIFIAFIFLFVRIERNLRVVRVAQAEDHA